MENVIFKYSDFFEDDGGFNKIRSDFDKLGDDLIKRAKEIKGNIKIFDLDDLDSFKKIESETENLMKVFEEYGKAKEEVNNIEKEYIKTLKKQSKTTDDQIDDLVRLDKELTNLKGDLKEINTLSKLGIKTDRDLNKERVQAELNIKKLNSEIRKNQAEILKANELSKEEEKLIKAKITLQNTEIKSLNQVRERIAALRVVVQSMDYLEQAEEIKAYNDEINTLTDTLSDNSDKFIQSKINVGNYEESIRNALESSDLFKTGIGQLDVAISSVTKLFSVTTKEAEEMEKTMGKNTTALQKFTIGFGKMNKALKFSVIGVLLIALGALASLFGNTRSGAANMEKAMLALSNTISAFGQLSMEIVKSVGSTFGGFFDNMKVFFLEMKNGFLSLTNVMGDNDEAIKENEKSIAKLNAEIKQNNEESAKTGSIWSRLGKILSNLKDSTVNGFEYIDKAFKLEDEIRRLERAAERLNGELEITNLRADDTTKSFKSMRLNAELAVKQQSKLSKLNNDIANKELEVINNKIRQQAVLNNLAGSELNIGLKGLAFAEATQRLAREKGVDLKLQDDLIQEQAQSMLKIIQLQNENNKQIVENAKMRRQINQDLFEQNLDILIDLIDTEKNISEAFVNNQKKNLKTRIDEYNRFLARFRENAQLEIQEFNTLFKRQADITRSELKQLGKDTSVLIPDLELKFDDENNTQLFLNGVELSLEQSLGTITDLNEQLQNAGIAENPLKRLLEILKENRNAKRDFDALTTAIREFAFALKQLENQTEVELFNNGELDKVNKKITELSKIKFGFFQENERKKVEKEIEKLEKRREEIARETDKKITENRISEIESMLQATYKVTEKGVVKEKQLYEDGSEERQALINEQLALKTKAIEAEYDLTKKSTEDEIAKQKEAYEAFVKEVERVTSLVIDKVIEVNQKKVVLAEDSLKKQEQLTDEQRRRAELGLTNTLAFEQREMGKREAELIKQQKKQERLQKIKALWTSYSSYSDKEKNPGDAILKTLKDFAILEAISASFGDGGVVEDRLPSNGIFRGQSHNGNGGGIPILVEGKEGIFSSREMGNLGKDNFYKMKELAGSGKIDSNFFSRQRNDFMGTTSFIPVQDDRFIKEIQSVKRAIENQPVTNWNVRKVTDGVLEIVEETVTKNHKRRNSYKTKKPRL